MLGLRLSADIESRLERLAERTRRSKSDVAREALLRYLDREDEIADLRRQVIAVAAHETASADADDRAFEAWLLEAQLKD